MQIINKYTDFYKSIFNFKNILNKHLNIKMSIKEY